MDKDIEFIHALEELIETFSNNQLPVNKQPSDNKHPLENLLAIMRQGLEVSATSIGPMYEYPNMQKLDKKFSVFMEHIETTTFHLDIIPYDKITECVFLKTPPEMLNKFTDELRSRGESHFKLSEPEETSSHEKNFLKIMRHIDLALVQKNSFANIKLKEMDALKENYRELDERYKALKDEADSQYKNMLTQYISILGIFAAILMGSFGAIQGFSNIFANADKIPLGNLLIISSIGASSVLLILFFLLNGIAKLTDRSLSSTKESNSTLLKKHPTLILSHGILISITLIGAALILSNTKLNLAVEGLWWIVPSVWIMYFITAVIKGKPLFFIEGFKEKFKRK